MVSTKSDPPQGYLIGEAAARSGVSAVNIRYYEKQGLLGSRGRADNSYRLYDDGAVHRLRFVRLCRAMDMSLGEVRTLLALDLRSKADCDAACITLDAHLGHVQERLQELRSLEQELTALRGCCDGSGATCHIIEALHLKADRQGPATQVTQAMRSARHV